MTGTTNQQEISAGELLAATLANGPAVQEVNMEGHILISEWHKQELREQFEEALDTCYQTVYEAIKATLEVWSMHASAHCCGCHGVFFARNSKQN